MYKKLLALSLALVLCVCPVFAVSDADNSYYSFEPVPYGSLGGRSLATLAAATSSGWTDTDHDFLNQIRLALTSKNTGTLLSYIVSIKDSVSNSYDKLFDIKRNTDYLQNINTNSNSISSYLQNMNSNSNSILSYLQNDINGPVIRSLLTDLKGGTRDMKNLLTDIKGGIRDIKLIWTPQQSQLVTSAVDRLQKTLASDEDIALAESQKPNRQQIEQDFASGSSGKTSLGASDFGDLSSVGGSVKDSLSLNGQSSISGFTGGLSDSDVAGQGWFSAETRDALDSVSSSSSYGLKRKKGNSDIYNMAGFEENYSWLYGG